MEQGEWTLTAEQACLELDSGEAEKLAAEAERMRALFEHMAQAPVDDLEPTTHAMVRENRVRSDQSHPFDNTEGLLDASPECEDEFFLIPNVL